ncbi:OLC1v1020136C1 [Oldenlandia corymbosa var. corymbosa]|uniref:OLC1v1020136C1 n=1 Tax=Oldenlandia corymbosa var. corymbosa TaxID=529605 RepID=A0AAV1EFT7_OLDCO|nr:OLC1v1020136C1 [Oldenlandia corymbosa var. corymbosa]
MDSTSPNQQRRPISIKLWPPSQNTRKTLVERMTNNLSDPSIFSRKYGSLSREEASKSAQHIEEFAFASASQHYEREPDGDGSSAVQLYARECSKLILDVLKKGPLPEDAGDLKPKLVVAEDKTFFDISKGHRAFIDAKEAQELLKPLSEPGNSFTKICFSNRSFGIDAAEVAAPILSSIKDQLKEVDLSDFVAGRPEADALEVMNMFSAALEGSILKSLNLSDNALGEKGVRAFGKLLKSQTSLEELYLMNDGISEEAARAVCELVPSTEKLKVLQFHNNMTGDEGARAIAEVVKRSPLLEAFRCSSTRVGSEGGIALSKALETCTHLTKLDVRDNMFGVDAGIALSKAVSSFENLTELYLSYLNLEDEGTIAIADALNSTAPALEVLELAGNEITAEGASSLATCVAAKQHLTKLILAENELKDDGAIKIGKVLLDGHDKLKEVDLSTNALRRVGARTIAQSVVNKPDFVLLNLNGNFISDEGIDELKDMFKKFPEKLAPVDDNDPDGEDDDGDEEGDKGSGDEGSGDELDTKLGKLDVKDEE